MEPPPSEPLRLARSTLPLSPTTPSRRLATPPRAGGVGAEEKRLAELHHLNLEEMLAVASELEVAALGLVFHNIYFLIASDFGDFGRDFRVGELRSAAGGIGAVIGQKHLVEGNGITEL